MSNSSTTEPEHDFLTMLLRRTSRMSNERHKQPTSFLTGDFHDYVEHNCKDRCSFLHYLGLLASSGHIFGVRAWSVIGFVNGARTSIPRCMEPPPLFHHCHFRGCDVELEEQCLGLLDQPCYCRHCGYGLYLLPPLSPVIRPSGLAFWARYFGCYRRFSRQSPY